jgi:hypothetical protein
MSGLILWDFQKAIYASLVADTAFMASVGNRLYDNVPQGTAYPLSVLVCTSEDDSEKTSDMEKISLEIHAWSRGRGMKEAITIAGLAKTSLHHQPTKGSSATVYCCHLAYINCLTFVEPDNITRHAVARFTAVAQPKT